MKTTAQLQEERDMIVREARLLLNEIATSFPTEAYAMFDRNRNLDEAFTSLRIAVWHSRKMYYPK